MRVAVVGGGASGAIAAGFSAKSGNDVVLLEKNNILFKKLLITGKGRCNITNNCDIADFFENIPMNPEFLYSALYSFTNADIIRLLNEYGVMTKVERGNRVFPVSDKAASVADALSKFVYQSGVTVKLNSNVKKIDKISDKFVVELENGEKLENIDKLIIATGGMSYPLTGSTGDGYKFAQAFGHTITELKGSLVPLEVKEDFVKDLVGLSLKNVKLTLINENPGKKDKKYTDFGEMMFSHYGVTGPLIISASSHINEKDAYTIYIDLKPALSEKQLDDRILRDFLKFQNKNFDNALGDLLPKRLISVVVALCGIPPGKKVNVISKEERKKLVDTLKNLKLTFLRKRPVSEAIITSGGISVKEINPSTMESKIIPNLYFCGEIIDTNAYTGGFNLQIAYSTGHLAGRG